MYYLLQAYRSVIHQSSRYFYAHLSLSLTKSDLSGLENPEHISVLGDEVVVAHVPVTASS